MGLLLLAGGIYWLMNTFRFSQRAVQTQGEIIQRYYEQGARSRLTVLVIKFRTSEDEERQFKESLGTLNFLDATESEVGRMIPVVYDPDNPTNARLRLRSQVWVGPVALTVLGLIVFVISFAA